MENSTRSSRLPMNPTQPPTLTIQHHHRGLAGLEAHSFARAAAAANVPPSSCRFLLTPLALFQIGRFRLSGGFLPRPEQHTTHVFIPPPPNIQSFVLPVPTRPTHYRLLRVLCLLSALRFFFVCVRASKHGTTGEKGRSPPNPATKHRNQA